MQKTLGFIQPTCFVQAKPLSGRTYKVEWRNSVKHYWSWSSSSVAVTTPGRQCTYNVKLKCVRATIFAVEKQRLIHTCVSVFVALENQHAKEHAPYCHMWSAPIYNYYPHFLINGKIFEKRYWIQNVFWIFLQLTSETRAEVSSSAPHLLHEWLSISPIKLPMSSQGVISVKEADNNHGLSPVRGQ